MANFRDLLNTANASSTASVASSDDEGIAVASAEPEIGFMSLEETYYDGLAYSGEEEFVPDSTGRYRWFEKYEDNNYSTVDDKKNIELNEKQFNITQEENSQFIPFEMPRYYDGIDLMDTTISIHYDRSDKQHGASIPVNVTYNSEKIRFAWLADASVTGVAGKIKFEIHATGNIYDNTGKEYGYEWKSRPNENLEVLQSLCGVDCGGIINVDSSWVTDLVEKVAESVATQIADAQVGAQVAAAENAAARAEKAATDAQSAATTAIKNELTNYSTTAQMKSYVSTEIAKADISSKLTEYAKTSEVEALVGNIGESENVIAYVDAAVAGVDVTEQLKDYAKSADVNASIQAITDNLTNNYYTSAQTDQKISASLEAYATKEEVTTAIAEADISEKLNDYYTKNETYSKDEVDTALKNVTVDLSDYATKTFVTEKTDALSASIDTNKGNIETLSGTVAELSEFVNGLNTDPSLRYRFVYDGTTGEYKLIECEGEEDETTGEVVNQGFITGGSGGSSTATTISIERVTSSPLTIISGDKAIIEYKFTSVDSSGDDTGEGIAVWKVGSTVVATNVAIQYTETNPYINSFDVTKYVVTGTQKVTLTVTDAAGTVSVKNWTVQVVDVSMTSSFNDTFTYSGDVTFSYTPYGAVEKEIHFILDGEEVDTLTTTSSGIPMSYVIPEQTHGSHLFETYITATVNGTEIETDHIYKDIMWTDGSDVPIISCTYQTFTARQYDSTNIVYTVYDPSTETPTVTHKLDNEVISIQTLSNTTNTWQFKSSEPGEHVLEIICGETVKTLYAYVEELDIDITPVTANLAFDFNPVGYSNNDADRLWTNGTVSMTVSDNFDWTNGGYKIDENGDQYFCIKAGTSAVIDYKLFEDDAKKNGKEMKLVFRTTNVQDSDAKFLTCIDSTTDADAVGIEMSVHEAYIYAQAGNLYLPYSEKDIIEFEFNINSDSETTARLSGYEDGVSTRHLVYDSSHGFTQVNPQYITLGSDHCDLHIYRFKAYNASLSPSDILNNFIADARNAEDMIDRYNRNQIYDPDKNYTLTPEYLAEKCPWLRVYIVKAPYFTNNKSDKVPGTTIQQIYKNGDPILDNWICYDCMHSGQGTSSNNYGGSGRNLDFIMNKSGVEGVDPYFLLGDGKTRVTEITQTRTSVPIAYLNAKVNIASANNFTNAMLANRYNEFNPYKRPFVREEGVDTSFIKDTMEFHNCVIFIQETNEDLSTHREFADTNVHFYAIGNIGDSKKSDKTRLTDMDDPYECCVEIMDVELPLSDFPQDTMMNAMGYEEDPDTKEIIYTWAKDENLGILYELIDGEYVLTEDTTVDLTKTYYVDILEHDDFSEDYTYGWRYISDDEDAEIVDYCHQRWIEFYRFVTNSTDEEFKAGLRDYFVVDSALYYYLFTTRYCMIDNRAKNSFWHYGWTGEYDEDSNKIRKWDLSWGYDFDSSMSLNNYGLMAYRYGLEDTDVDETGKEIFREMDSRFFCRIRDLFSTELKAMYNTLESKGAWHAESFLNKIEAWQNEFPEELWRLDIDRKYIRTYTSTFINGEGDAQFLKNMANGKMKYAIKEWERSQEKYMASKYQSSLAANDNAVIRCTTPTGDLVVEPNYKLKLIPFNYMYLNVTYGTASPIQVKAEPNKVYEIPFTGTSTDIIGIYSASCLRSLGDLSTCYPATVDTSKASRITELTIGNATEGYDNPNFTTLTLGANPLLEKLNLENVSGLTQSLELSLLANLKELYAHGTNTAGVTFADGGLIEIAELPAITAMTMKNLMYLTSLDVVSFEKLTKLVVENCSTVELLSILNAAPNLNRARILGVDWTLEDTSLLQRIYDMYGVDNNGYNIPRAVLSGKVFVPVIRQQELREFNDAWSDLEITYNTLIEQYPVTFVNEDGTILDVQYVDKGSDAVDPITREDNPIAIPTKESTVSTDYTFAGWDIGFTGIFAARTITATYSESTREYTITYKSKGVTIQESTGLYGDNIPYTGDIPTYTLEESAYSYYLFDKWDKSGIIDGDKVVNAVFDSCNYNEGYFEGKDISELRPVEIYAMTKLGLETNHVEMKDSISLSFGNDYNYDDVESIEIISEKTVFNGKNYIDSGITLLDEDRDFVIAIDYKMSSDTTLNGTLAQCFQSNGTNGFRLYYNNGVKTVWGNTSQATGTTDSREMLVLRHVKGESGIYMYYSNLAGTEISYYELESTRSNVTPTSTLVFGCQRADDGLYENFAFGEIHWAKVWYADLGDSACRDLAIWTHEKLTLEMAGFKNYYLSDNSNKRCSMTFLASHLLDRDRAMSTASTNTGGWEKATLNTFMNDRMYKAIETKWRQLIKKVKVASSIGDKSTDLSYSDCYLTVPALVSVAPSETAEPYVYEGTGISYMATNESRIRCYANGEAGTYWTRSPHVTHANYYCRIDKDGSVYKYVYPNYTEGILVELSI